MRGAMTTCVFHTFRQRQRGRQSACWVMRAKQLNHQHQQPGLNNTHFLSAKTQAPSASILQLKTSFKDDKFHVKSLQSLVCNFSLCNCWILQNCWDIQCGERDNNYVWKPAWSNLRDLLESHSLVYPLDVEQEEVPIGNSLLFFSGQKHFVNILKKAL